MQSRPCRFNLGQARKGEERVYLIVTLLIVLIVGSRSLDRQIEVAPVVWTAYSIS